jgi:hypothetical protein
METLELSDAQLLQGLRQHPQIRSRLASLLALVEDSAGDLKRADDAEDRLVQEIRRLGQESLQAWAQGQVQQTEQELRRGGRAHREGKKNSAGTPPLATSACKSPNTAVASAKYARLPAAQACMPGAAPGAYSAP